MDPRSTGRLALLSIRPQFAEAIMDGSKRVEFRKRRLAPDVNTAVVYATLPLGMVLGVFTLGGQEEDAPQALWARHQDHAGISRDAYDDYFRDTSRAVGILVREPRPFDRPLPLGGLREGLRAPQSFVYLERAGLSLAPWI